MKRVAPGDRISEFVLERRLGEGGFGEVWLAHHHVWRDRRVAVKLPASPEQARLLENEGVLQDLVRHPNAVEVLGLDPTHDPPYLILEYVEGRSLRERLREGRLGQLEAIAVARPLLSALAYAHERGVVHRDLKPGNVLIADDGTVKLADFGLGRLRELERSQLALSATFASRSAPSSGTLAYMAPEQRAGAREIDARADVYAFGILWFEMLTGALPEGREVPSDLRPELDEGCDEIFSRCYCRLERRYPDAAAVLADLEALEQRLVMGERSGEGQPARLQRLGGGKAAPLFGERVLVGSGSHVDIRLRDRAVRARHVWIERVGERWTIRAAGPDREAWLLPAHVPYGRQAEQLAERIGQASLALAHGMTIVLGPLEGHQGVRLRFFDGPPARLPEARVRTSPSGAAVSPPPASEAAVQRRRSGSGALAWLAAAIAFVVSWLVLERFGAPLWALVGAAATAVIVREIVRGDGEDTPPSAPRPGSGSAAAGEVSAASVAAVPRHALADGGVRTAAFVFDCVLFAVVFPVWWFPLGWLLYDWLTTGLFGGSFGKLALGLQVVDGRGRPVGLLRGGIRTVGRVLSTIPFGLGYLLAFVTVSRQAFHDFLADTRVVRTRMLEATRQP